MVCPSSDAEKLNMYQRVADIIRAYQAKQLYDEFKLTSLYIYHDTISKSFEHQVLARLDPRMNSQEFIER
jgi:hypothetical protein